MDHKKSYRYMFWGWVLGLGCILIGAASNRIWLGILGMIILAVAFAQGVINFKCPHCGEGWNIRGAKPDYCPHCGEKIDW